MPLCSTVRTPSPPQYALSCSALVANRREQGLPADLSRAVFANFNKIDKLDPESFSLWMQVLRRVPGSVLWLLEPGAVDTEVGLRRWVFGRHGTAKRRNAVAVDCRWLVWTLFLPCMETNSCCCCCCCCCREDVREQDTSIEYFGQFAMLLCFSLSWSSNDDARFCTPLPERTKLKPQNKPDPAPGHHFDTPQWCLAAPEEQREAIHRRLREEAESQGVDGRRIVWAKWVPKSEHLLRHALADLFLDTLTYGAHSTATDALAGGLPFLTLAGAIARVVLIAGWVVGAWG